MKTLKQVTIEPVFVELMPEFWEQNKVYISEPHSTSAHLCLCGCGQKAIMPLGGGQWWTLVKEKNGTVSFIGSVGNYSFPCKSHYIITKNVANFV
ncbi:MAG: DUF6527 family protein [Bacteroidota bacterium]